MEVGGHTPQSTQSHGKVQQMCAGRSVIADTGMSRWFRKQNPRSHIAVLVQHVDESVARNTAVVFALYEQMGADREKNTLAPVPLVVPPPITRGFVVPEPGPLLEDGAVVPPVVPAVRGKGEGGKGKPPPAPTFAGKGGKGKGPRASATLLPPKGKGEKGGKGVVPSNKGGPARSIQTMDLQAELLARTSVRGAGLRPQTSVVTNRDGTRREERRIRDEKTGEVIGVEYRLVEHDSSAETAESAAEGTSLADHEYHRKPFRIYQDGRWQKIGAGRTIGDKEQGGPLAEDGAAKKNFTLVTWNTYFGPTTSDEAVKNFGEISPLSVFSQKIEGVFETLENRKSRHERLVGFILDENPDVVCLQEVRQPLLDVLESHPQIRENYAIAHAVRGAAFEYGLAMLVRRIYTTDSAKVYDFGPFTVHNRFAMVAEISLGASGHRLLLATTHLDSEKEEKANRKGQLQFLVEKLSAVVPVLPDEDNKEASKDEESRADVLLCGDMNFGVVSDEQAWFSEKYGARFGDVWPEFAAEDCGGCATAGATRGSERLDRVFAARGNALQVVGVRLLGEAGVGGVQTSDHAGIVAEFRL